MSEQALPESPESEPTYEPNPEAVEPTEASPAPSATAAPAAPSGMGTFAEDGTYIPRSITEDDLGGMSMDDAYTATMVEVEDGQIVEGTVVKVDRARPWPTTSCGSGCSATRGPTLPWSPARASRSPTCPTDGS